MDRGRVQETQKHGFVNKCYIIFLLLFGLCDDIESCNYGFLLFFYSFEELVTSGVGIHPEKTTN